MSVKQTLFALSCSALLCLPAHAQAEINQGTYSPSLSGPLGLNTTPSARMDKTGTVRIGLSTLDPYVHGYIGFQLADPLYINLRQSGEFSSLNNDPDRLYPGIDFKLRLFKETHARPEIALGLQSAIGHKRMAGEYIALSKRYKNFDFTAGVGWGRFAGAAHLDNPLKGLLSHFGKARAPDGEMPNEPKDWFTGEHIGFFGGVEYFTPVRGLSLKADIGADRYEAEKAAFGFDAPAPWSVGASYSPTEWANLSLAMQGTDKIMGRLSLSGLLSDWRGVTAGKKSNARMRHFRTGLALPGQMELAAGEDELMLFDTRTDNNTARTHLRLAPGIPAPYQIGRAAVHMANHAGHDIERLSITPTVMGLQGPRISLMRADLERALTLRQGSPEEIWQNAIFDTDDTAGFRKLKRGAEVHSGMREFHFTLDNQLSLSDEDHGNLYRTSLLAGYSGTELFGFLDSALSFRLNLKDNLYHLRDYRPRAILPVRSNVDDFAARRIALEHLYSAFTHSFTPEIHLSLIGGYLEEMYGGAGGEILYRPAGKRFALGAESWLAFKRDPLTTLNLGLNGDHLLTGHVKAWYDIPGLDLTVQAKAGRYLAEDIGGTISLQKNFENGVKLEGFVTVTNYADFDLFGGTTHAYNGLRLSLPLGGYKYAPDNASIRVKAAPFGRDIGQTLDNPIPLYELTEAFSTPHMIRYWGDVID